MKIIVIGSSGKLGQQIVTELRDYGHDVIGIDKRPSKNEQSTTTHIVDISEPGALAPLLAGADAICHAGTSPSIKPYEEQEVFQRSVGITFNVFHSAAEVGIRKVAWASSIQAYGVVGAPQPWISFPEYLPVDEDHPLLPRTPYQLSKQVGESMADAFTRRCTDMQIFSLRYTYLLRPGRDLIDHTNLQGSLNTFVTMPDAARAMRLCCETERPGHTQLNIVSSKTGLPWTESGLIEAFGSVPPFRRPVRSDESLISPDRAREILGFEA